VEQAQAESYNKKGPISSGGEMSERTETLKEVIQYLKNYRRAYSEDFCPPRNLEEFDPTIRTIVAFHMGRFLIDNMLKDARAALVSSDELEEK
jgi:hypothetical protein